MYPAGRPARAWFAHYAERFDTVELNNTFYRLPAASTVEGWAAQAPPGFCYAVKVGQFGSHRMKLRDAASWLPNHLDRVERLGAAPRAEPVQLPPRWKRDVDRLDEFLAAAPRRHPLGRRAARAELAARRRLRPCSPGTAPRSACTTCCPTTRGCAPPTGPTCASTGRTRSSDPYRGRYGGRRLRAGRATASQAWLDEGTDVYAYFNNDYDGHAVTDAEWLRARLEGARRR